MLLRKIARPLLATAFVGQGADSLRNSEAAANAAGPTVYYLRHLPDSPAGHLAENPRQLAVVNAVIQIGAGLLLATGKMPRLASATLAATVIPGNLGAHMFWTEDDPERRAEKRRSFLVDVSLLGGLVIASADTAGRPSLGWRGRRAAELLTERVSSTLLSDKSDPGPSDGELGERIVGGLWSGAAHGRELLTIASEKSEPALEGAIKRGTEFAETARDRGTELAAAVRQRGRSRRRTAAKRFATLLTR